MAKRTRKRAPKSRNQRNNFKDKDRLTDTGGLSKADREADERDRRDYSRSRENDPMWYAQNAQLLSDYGSFPFGTPIGISLPATLGLPNQTAVPGFIAIYYAPAIGPASSETDPINIAARNIYSYVRHANSGHSNYDSPDLMMYLIAMDSVYMFHAYMKRLLGIILDYTPVNRYYPRALIRAMGVDPDDLAANIADFRGFINQYAVQIGSMCVPNSMSYMARHTWMTEGLYTDSTAAKAQTYFYCPNSYYKLQVVDSSGVAVTSLVRTRFFQPSSIQQGATLKKVSDIITFAQELLAPIITNEDMNIMSGDILKAFGPEGVVRISGVLDGYMVLPVYNQEVLSQIENLRAVASNITGGVTQDTSIGGGYLIAEDNVSFNFVQNSTDIGIIPASLFSTLTGDKLVNFHHDGVTPAEVMVATRLTAAYSYAPQKPVIGSGVTLKPVAYGSELITNVIAFYNLSINGKFDSGLQVVETVSPAIYQTGAGSMGPLDLTLEALNTAAIISNFDWHHAIYQPILDLSTPATPVVMQPDLFVQDIDNYTVLSVDNLLNLHTAALLSEFSVPQMGAFSTKI